MVTHKKRLIAMLGILAGGRPGMEAARIAQRVDREIDLAVLAGDDRLDLSSVILELVSGLCLETHGLLTGP